MEPKHARIVWKLFYVALGAAAFWFLLPWLLPFLLALGLSALLEPAVSVAMRRLHCTRSLGAALCLVGVMLLVGGLLTLALVRGCYELGVLTTRLPQFLGVLPDWKQALEAQLYRMVVAAPIPVQDFLRTMSDGIVAQGVTVPGALYAWLLDFIARTTAALPSALLFAFTTLLATYFSSAHRPSLMRFLRRQLPLSLRPKLHAIKIQLSRALGGWFRVQGILLLVTFTLLTAGLLLMGVDLALFLAAGIAVLDALPVFGSGAALIPWAVVSLLAGDPTRAVGLALLYAVLSLSRSFLEPKLVGDRVGLPPLVALFSMYGGFRFFGVAGMILAPLLAIAIKQLHDCGVWHLWRD